MGFYLLPLFVATFFLGMFSLQTNFNSSILPSVHEQRVAISGQIFIQYRDDLARFQKTNPSFLGVVPSSSLTSQYPAAFLAVAGNEITVSSSGAGRLITAFAKLDRSAIVQALAITDNDASLGFASGGSWRSAANGVNLIDVPLATAVPDGSAVSVVQIGV